MGVIDTSNLLAINSHESNEGADIATDSVHHHSALNKPRSILLLDPTTWCILSVGVCFNEMSPLCSRNPLQHYNSS